VNPVSALSLETSVGELASDLVRHLANEVQIASGVATTGE
jgi:hypothetical protein